MLAAIVMCAALAIAAGNPPVENCASQAEAFNRAMACAAAEHGELVPTTGTGSMRPLIPGKAVLVVRKDFGAAAVGNIIVYFGRVGRMAAEEISLCHRARLRDAGGFVMQGDANAAAEWWQRVTPKNYRGTVIAIFNYPADVWPARGKVESAELSVERPENSARPRSPETARP